MAIRRNRTQPIEGPVTHDAVRDWLIAELCRRTGAEPSQIDPTKSFEAYGLDSTAAVQVSGLLEKAVGQKMSPALLFQYPTIDALAGHVSNAALRAAG